jgi:hypothetical protein
VDTAITERFALLRMAGQEYNGKEYCATLDWGVRLFANAMTQADYL